FSFCESSSPSEPPPSALPSSFLLPPSSFSLPLTFFSLPFIPSWNHHHHHQKIQWLITKRLIPSGRLPSHSSSRLKLISPRLITRPQRLMRLVVLLLLTWIRCTCTVSDLSICPEGD
ncbi:hypothetical protein PRIPAC_91676, partial [Pristionchus pacificus]